jgi:hypothetical protein
MIMHERLALASSGRLQQIGHRISPVTPVTTTCLAEGIHSRRILHEFGMELCNPIKTLCSTMKLHKRKENERQTDSELYHYIVTKLVHLAI